MSETGLGLLNEQLMESLMPRRRKKDDVMSVRDILADAIVHQLLPLQKREELINGQLRSLFVHVPSTAWVLPIGESLDFLSDKLNVIRRLDGKRAEDESNRASRWLSQGASVVYVAAAPEHIPDWFRTAAQDTAVVPAVDHKLVRTVLRQVCTGRIPASLAKVNLGVLDFDELSAVIVAGQPVSIIVQRIQDAVDRKTRTARIDERLPDMLEAVEFGDARLWALDLKADLDDYQAGTIGWDSVDRGAIVFGDSGTGKTVFARSLAQYLSVPLVQTSMGELFASGTGYLDSTVKAQRAAFDQARAASPCVMLIDELDQLPDLDKIDSRNRDYWSVLVAEFLTLLDGAGRDREGVVVIGTTNRLHAIAPTVRRPGRLERAIEIGHPSEAGIARIIQHHAPALAGADLDDICTLARTRRLTAAEVMEAVRSARRRARREGRQICATDLADVLLPPLDIPLEELQRVAVHEAGHCVVAANYSPERLQGVTVSDAGAFAAFRMPPTAAQSRETIEQHASVLLAGREAEKIVCGRESAGSGGSVDSDLGRAMIMLASARTSLGLHTPSWRCSPEDIERLLMIDHDLRKKVDEDVELQSTDARRILIKNENVLMALRDALIDRRFLDGDAIRAVIEGAGGIVPLGPVQRVN